jgi:hypothetical protein
LVTENVVKVLLDHGANPNERFGEYTCWQNSLIWQYEHLVALEHKRSAASSKAKDLAEHQLKIMQLLIKYWADMDVSVKVNGEKVSLGIVLDEYFKLCEADHVKELKEMGIRRRGKSHNFMIRKFAF